MNYFFLVKRKIVHTDDTAFVDKTLKVKFPLFHETNYAKFMWSKINL